MSDDRRGMGRGLAAILPRPGDEDGLREIPVELIDPNPRQPRQTFDEVKLGELAESIRTRGVLQPIVVRPLAGGRYELRRRRAPPARRPDRGARADPGHAAPGRGLGAARPRARGEHGAAEPQRRRGGARVRDARRRPRAHQGGGRPAGRPQPRRDLQPDPPARPARGGARADRGRPPQRGPRSRHPALQGPRRAQALGPLAPATAPGRCGRRNAARATPSTRRPRRASPRSCTPISPRPWPPRRTRSRLLWAATSRPAPVASTVSSRSNSTTPRRRSSWLARCSRRGSGGSPESVGPPLQSAFAWPRRPAIRAISSAG